MLARQMSNGKMYVCRTSITHAGRVNSDISELNNIFTIMNKGLSGAINSGVIYFPRKMVGQKIRLLIEPYPEETLEGVYCDCGKPADDEDMKCHKCRKWEKIEKKRKKRKKNG